IYLVDRKKDMIIRGGENVYSVEIENVLITHPSIDSCAVIGVPDTVLGEKICGIVVTRGTVPDDLIGELKDLCRRELAGFKVPELWEVIDELPRTATGKIQKAPLRASFLDRQKETQ
ncbi:MAG: class I adenylate-forming enzyme family protein, partial [Roseovarius indicus]